MAFEPVRFESSYGIRDGKPRVTIGVKGNMALNKFFVKEYRIKNGTFAHFAYDHDNELLQIRFMQSNSKYTKEIKVSDKGYVNLALGSLFRTLGVNMPQEGTRVLVIRSTPKTKPQEGIVFECRKKYFENRDVVRAEEIDLSGETEEEEEVIPAQKTAKKKVTRKKMVRRKTRA